MPPQIEHANLRERNSLLHKHTTSLQPASARNVTQRKPTQHTHHRHHHHHHHHHPGPTAAANPTP
eukprot:12905080-Prorocentrum_lima.AAC.1